jgi:hypothetical protein
LDEPGKAEEFVGKMTGFEDERGILQPQDAGSPQHPRHQGGAKVVAFPDYVKLRIPVTTLR